MRFVQKWSYACAKRLAAATKENHQKRAVYYYGFYIIIGAAVKGFILISAASLLGILAPTLLIALAFASLRAFAGGYHMDTYGKCLFVSMGLFIGAASIAQYTYPYWSPAYMAVLIGLTFILGLYALVRYAPKDTPNKPITDPQEIKRYKKLSIAYLFVWLALTIGLTVFGLKRYMLSLCFGVLLELFTVTPAGHRFFGAVKNGLHKKPAPKQKSLCD